MITDLSRKNRHIFTIIVALLSVCISFASIHIYDQQKQQLHSGLMRKTATEIDFIGAILTDTMLRHDYSEALELLSDWPLNHPEVTQLTVTFDNGRVFFTHDDKAKTDAFHVQTRTFQYAERTLTLKMSHDASGNREALANLSRNLFALSLFLIALMGIMLWFILFRWMIKPMEQEIARQTKKLRDAHDTLEAQVLERTASLSAEVEVRKKAELSVKKLVRAVEQSPIIVFITDTKGIIEYVNPKFEQITGYSREEAIGKTPSLIKSPNTPKEVHDDLWATILSGHEWSHEIVDCRKDGTEFWANVHISSIRDGAGNVSHFVALHEDITERKNAEQATQDARQAAELANKAKTDLMANMSHELRTPLNAIIGFSETMKHSVFGPLGNSQYEEYADYIHSSGSHLLQLINDILDVSAVEAGKLELREDEVNIADICDAALQIIYPQARDLHIELEGIARPNLPLLRADPLRIKQIFINLLSNAVKFTPELGVVSCNAYVDDDNSMVITVTDTGIGMTQEGIAKALDKFGQVDSSLSRKHEGTGLGLPLTKGLVELHGGFMLISSKLDEGTKVSIVFPSDRIIREETSAHVVV